VYQGHASHYADLQAVRPLLLQTTYPRLASKI
jgi:hypothetical protein